ncbi:hypothetical protein THAOC_16850 [Thalassiosira oceanica]|uniref:Uncharacterized protein n=1 Tax=Thalassiosira oceanica TaxID=159749 RepID=K0SC63_THAOC|nr:hypothetical protein THAOC_16850 [Thalassiosira oceanica]|eukprot:EJK62534.1 hypothetical protein THAOC_16850 [Thalassiosira oceanica]
MCIIWSCVALGIVPYDPASVLTGAVVYDPVQSLKKLLSNLPVGNAFLALVNILAASAICTTVIGSMLASTQYFRDFKFRGNNSGSVAPKSELMHGKAGEVLLNSLAIIPSACVAYCGSSDLYFLASQFAGEFPCTFLYGLLPSLCNLKLRLHDGSIKSAKGKVAIEWLLVAISMSILMIINDVIHWYPDLLGGVSVPDRYRAVILDRFKVNRHAERDANLVGPSVPPTDRPGLIPRAVPPHLKLLERAALPPKRVAPCSSPEAAQKLSRERWTGGRRGSSASRRSPRPQRRQSR